MLLGKVPRTPGQAKRYIHPPEQGSRTFRQTSGTNLPHTGSVNQPKM